MYLCNFTLDNLSLMALTICVGFVVDDAIVVIENVFRFVEKGETPFQAALQGARQIGFTVVSMSISLVAVFIPLLFMGGLMGRLLSRVCGDVELGNRDLRRHLPDADADSLRPLSSRQTASTTKAGLRSSELAFNWVLHTYERSLRWVLRHQHFMLFVTVLTMAGTVWLYWSCRKVSSRNRTPA